MTTWRAQVGPIRFLPSSIAGLPNGRFPSSALWPIQGQVPGSLCPEAQRAWDAMFTAAAADGVALSSEGPEGSYRPLDAQVALLHENYTTTANGSSVSLVYEGRRWYRKPGGVIVATPGQSNHGLGLAVDVLGAAVPGAVLAWLEAHAATYGWQWETSESWHIHYTVGDQIPPAVIDAATTTRKANTMIIVVHSHVAYLAVPAGASQPKPFLIRLGDPTEVDRSLGIINVVDADWSRFSGVFTII